MENKKMNYKNQFIADELKGFRHELMDLKKEFQKMNDEKKLKYYNQTLEILKDAITDFDKTILVIKEIRNYISDEMKIVHMKREKND